MSATLVLVSSHGGRLRHETVARSLLRAWDLADARFAEPLRVADLARASRFSSAHFSRLFKEAFGESPHEYLLTRRLERAATMLRESDRSVVEICLAVGWSSVGSFTASFRRIHGEAPLSYRRRCQPHEVAAPIPLCVVKAYGRPKNRTFREEGSSARS